MQQPGPWDFDGRNVLLLKSKKCFLQGFGRSLGVAAERIELGPKSTMMGFVNGIKFVVGTVLLRRPCVTSRPGFGIEYSRVSGVSWARLKNAPSHLPRYCYYGPRHRRITEIRLVT